MKFLRNARILAIQASCFAIASLYILGESYLTTGHGLHPMLVGVLIGALLAWPYFTNEGE